MSGGVCVYWGGGAVECLSGILWDIGHWPSLEIQFCVQLNSKNVSEVRFFLLIVTYTDVEIFIEI